MTATRPRSLPLVALWPALLAGCLATATPRPEVPRLPPGVPVLRVQAFSDDGEVRLDGHIVGVPSTARIAVDREGNILIAVPGRTGAGGGILRKFSPGLDPVWTVSFAGLPGHEERFTAFTFTPGRNDPWLASKEMPTEGTAGSPNWVFRKFTAAGVLSFSRSACFGGCNGIPTAILPAPKGGWIVVGIEEKVSVITHFSATGWPEWTWIDEGAHLVGAATNESADVYACGVRPVPGGPAWEVVKLSREGKLVWTRSFTAGRFAQHPARANAIAATVSGVVVAGTRTGPALPPADDWQVKAWLYDGSTAWEDTLGAWDDRMNVSNDEARAVALAEDGSAFVLGEVAPPPPGVRALNGQSGPVLRRYDASGALVWSRTTAAAQALGLGPNGLAITAGVVLTGP